MSFPAGKQVLIHACCAPCLLGPLEALRAEGVVPSVYFYNPNIHPFLEFRKRMKAMQVFMETDSVPVEIDAEYGLDLFVREVYDAVPETRCENCYRLRLRDTAENARRRNCDAFTTTLLSSPYQHHETIQRVGEAVAEETGVPFLYRDFRPLHEKSQSQAKKRKLYRQSYCGCCFSEYERYRHTSRELYRGPGPKGRSGGNA